MIFRVDVGSVMYNMGYSYSSRRLSLKIGLNNLVKNITERLALPFEEIWINGIRQQQIELPESICGETEIQQGIIVETGEQSFYCIGVSQYTDGCFVDKGSLIISLSGLLYQIPIEDIVEVELVRFKGTSFVVRLLNGILAVNFMTQKDIDFWNDRPT